MAEYLYEMHLHTNVASKCGGITPEEVVRLYKAMGYAGVFVTEHFLNGNSSVDRSLPWEEKIRRYADGYEQVKAAAEADGGGLDVFFGVEYHMGNAAEALLYGVTPEWLTAHEEIMAMGPRQVLDFFRSEGILVYQAHPFRLRAYVPYITLFPQSVDGIEVFNINNDEHANRMAEAYAKEYGFRTICGSDLHNPRQPRTTAFTTPFRLTEPLDVKKALETGETGMRILENPLLAVNP